MLDKFDAVPVAEAARQLRGWRDALPRPLSEARRHASACRELGPVDKFSAERARPKAAR